MSDAMHAARLVALEAAVLSLLREAQEEDGPDALTLTACRTFDGGVEIDLEWQARGQPVAGESL